MAAKGKTQTYLDKNPEAKAKKNAYQKEYNKRPEQVKKRVELNKVNRERGTYGNGDGLDMAHTKNGIVKKKASVNRGSKTDTPGDVRARGKKKK
jgi:hypothetical protein